MQEAISGLCTHGVAGVFVRRDHIDQDRELVGSAFRDGFVRPHDGVASVDHDANRVFIFPDPQRGYVSGNSVSAGRHEIVDGRDEDGITDAGDENRAKPKFPNPLQFYRIAFCRQPPAAGNADGTLIDLLETGGACIQCATRFLRSAPQPKLL